MYDSFLHIETPRSIPIGELIKLIDGRIDHIEHDGFIIKIWNGHVTFTSKKQIEKSNRLEKMYDYPHKGYLDTSVFDDFISRALKGSNEKI